MRNKLNDVNTEEEKLIENKAVYYMQNREEIIQRRIVICFLALFVLFLCFIFFKNNQIKNNDQLSTALVTTEGTTEPTTVTSEAVETGNAVSLNEVTTSNEYENVLLCWGDSFSENKDDSISFYSYYIYEKLAGEGNAAIKGVYSAGSSEETLLSLVGKFGSYPLYTKAFVIPGDTTPVQVQLESTYDKTDIILDKATNPGLNPCEICGVKGNLTSDGEKNYFKRLEMGESVAVPDKTNVISNLKENMRGYISLFFFGNGYNNTPNEAVQLYKSIINTINNDKYIIVGPIVGTDKDIDPYDKAFSEAFGKHYISFREYMCSTAFDDYEISITSKDLESLKNNSFPESFMFDEARLSDKTASILGDVVYNKLKELGII